MAYNKQVVDAVLGAGESSEGIVVVGQCDILVSGLTGGQVNLQYKLSKTPNLPSPDWTDFPEGSFTSDVYKTVFISEHGIKCRLTGVGNNAGVYVRLGRFLNN